MIDNQIITILECCASDENIKCCRKCALCEKYDCYSEISKNALNLINRQKAEIEKLTDEKIFYMDKYHEFAKTAECVKEEAIKEFAERLKKRLFYDCGDINYTEVCDTQRLIDNLVKEMTEE